MLFYDECYFFPCRILLSLAKEYAHTTFLLWLRIQFNEAVRENYIPSFPIKTNSINVSAHVAKGDIEDVNLEIAASCKACDEGLVRAL